MDELWQEYEDAEFEELLGFHAPGADEAPDMEFPEYEEEEASDELAWEAGEMESPGRHSSLALLAERVVAAAPELLREASSAKWTTCFLAADVGRAGRAYKENLAAALKNPVDRASCIVMLNVALGQLLPLPLRRNRARGTSKRYVKMGNLTTHSIESAMAQLQKKGYALNPWSTAFYDVRSRTAGTLAPQRLKTSVRDKLLELSASGKCWFAFGLSILDGYHSVLLLVDRTGPNAAIHWFDQFSPRPVDLVTDTLDERLVKATQAYWQEAKKKTGKGFDTTVRVWPLRKRK